MKMKKPKAEEDLAFRHSALIRAYDIVLKHTAFLPDSLWSIGTPGSTPPRSPWAKQQKCGGGLGFSSPQQF